MKRFVLLMLTAIFFLGIATAQNANRNGFFVEVGFGGLVGSTPRTSFSIKDKVLSYKCLAGAAGDFGLGGRIRVGNHWAYELKAEAQLPFSNSSHSLVGRVLPVGFRYTSVELFKNYSLYAHFNVGGAMTLNKGIIDSDDILMSDLGDTKIGNAGGGAGYGVAYSAGIGVNITTHFYAECAFNGQFMSGCYGKDGKGSLNYGIVAFILGYRF